MLCCVLYSVLCVCVQNACAVRAGCDLVESFMTMMTLVWLIMSCVLYCTLCCVLYCTRLYCELQCTLVYCVLCPVDGMCSEDGLSSGGEFYDNDDSSVVDNVEFRRPAPDIVIKSVPIVPSQQASVTSS